MHTVSIADSFIDSLARLDPSDVKRAAAFVDKLVRDPSAPGMQPEIVHDAADRTIRSFRVTHDLRSIVHVDGERLLLLYVARHDVAYAWARDRCIECHPVTRELQVVADPSSASRRLAAHGAVVEAARIAGGGGPGTGLFDGVADDALLGLGVPESWLSTIRMVRGADML
ncbi:MAG: DNA helicase, partial [Actinobacteria bacterium]